MALKFRPINRSDISRMIDNVNAGKITSPDIKDVNGTVISARIFKKYDESANPDKKEVPSEFTKLGYIDLAIRVINPFLAGANASVWKLASGMENKDVEDILNYRAVFDLQTEKHIKITKAEESLPYDAERYLMGADYMEYIIKKQNFDALVKQKIYSHYSSKISKALGIKKNDIPATAIYEVDAQMLNKVVSGEGPDGVLHIDKRYVVDTKQIPTFEENMDFEEMLQLESDIEGISQDEAAERIIKFDPLTILSILRDEGPEVLLNQIMTYMFVLPYGYRQSIGERHDKLTVAYSELIKENDNVENVLLRKSIELGVVLDKCRKLVNAIKWVMIQKGDHQTVENYKSLVDRIKGKEGLIRGRMEGARYDYTARTVITCDPEMPITKVGIPIKILEKVAEPAVIQYFKKSQDERYKHRGNMTSFSKATDDTDFGVSYIDVLKEMFANQTIYGLIGRQPTLFYLGIQGFEIVPVEGNAIVLSPLVVMPFNADFDGDQMHFTLPITKDGIKDVTEKMLFKNNMWYPKNGSCTVEIRHEIQYGIWVCANDDFSSRIAKNPQSYSGLKPNEIYDKVISQEINVYDTVDGVRAGKRALFYAMYKNTEYNEAKIPSKIKGSTFTKTLLANCTSVNAFTDAINRIVKLGFGVAKIYPPDISVIVEDDTIQRDIRKMVEEFNQIIQDRYEYVKLGVEIYDNYSMYFDQESDKLTSKLKKYLQDKLPYFNGYNLMATSGAKGDISNLLQIFGIKGRIQKNDSDSFNMLIEGNYSSSLTGMEHFVTAYGSRKGIADKVLATAEPGYLSRKLEHAAPTIKIRAYDCGTKNGVKIYPEDIIPSLDPSILSPDGPKPIPTGSRLEVTPEDVKIFYSKSSNIVQFDQAKEYVIPMIVGRFVVLNGRSIYVSNDGIAEEVVNTVWGNYEEYQNGTRVNPDPIILRSPLTCEKPVCSRCYGKNLAHGIIGKAWHKDAKELQKWADYDGYIEDPELQKRVDKYVEELENERYPRLGDRVGFIAAQSIGEPGTQLTMKNFQKGGVAGAKNITSSFEVIEKLFDMGDFSKSDTRVNGMITHNPVSPVTGWVKSISVGSGRKQIIITDHPDGTVNLLGNQKIYIVPEQTKLKPFVFRGDTILRIYGNVSIYECLRYQGYERAVKSLIMNLYNIFKKNNVNLIHFEIIALSMSCGYVTFTNNKRYKEGDIISLEEARNNGATIIPTLVGIKSLPAYKVDFIECMAMENVTTYLPRSMITSKTDTMTNPLIRIMFGLDMNEEE